VKREDYYRLSVSYKKIHPLFLQRFIHDKEGRENDLANIFNFKNVFLSFLTLSSSHQEIHDIETVYSLGNILKTEAW
jgi:hypothetical protein